jgi:predicted RNase H-like nuclease (RuvC/YqgF family)
LQQKEAGEDLVLSADHLARVVGNAVYQIKPFWEACSSVIHQQEQQQEQQLEALHQNLQQHQRQLEEQMEVLELLEAQLQELLQLAADVSLHQVTQCRRR